ncbi:MAG: restriction endonuclease subunit R, partial [Cyanobacteria bacterium P01_E01_bin.35]
DVDNAINSASELKYVGGIKALLKKQMHSPHDDFVKYFFRELCPDNKFTGQLKEDFFGYTLRGVKEFITEEMKHLLDDAVNPPEASNPKPDMELKPVVEDKEFTEDEREGYYILKAILSSIVEPSRVTYKDTANYCNILLDNNTWKPIVRLHFNNPARKKLEIFSIDDQENRISEKVSIDNLNDIYQYAEKFEAIMSTYL